MFSIIQPIFLQKTKPLYPHLKYLFGIGIWIWAAQNKRFSLHVSIVRGTLYSIASLLRYPMDFLRSSKDPYLPTLILSAWLLSAKVCMSLLYASTYFYGFVSIHIIMALKFLHDHLFWWAQWYFVVYLQKIAQICFENIKIL